MTQEKTINKTALYVAMRKFFSSLVYFSSSTFVMIAIVSLYTLLFTPNASNVLKGTVDLGYWFKLLDAPIISFSLVYSLLTTPIEVLTKRLAVRRKTLTFSDGLLWRRQKSIPYSAINEVAVSQSLLQRIFGFSKISVKYAGLQQLQHSSLPESQANKLLREVAHISNELELQGSR